MENLYVTFTVGIAETEYSYGKDIGRAKAEMQLPRQIVLDIEPVSIFRGLVQAALDELELIRARKETEKETNDG